MNYLITGGAGYIGSCVSQLLIDKGHKVIIIDNLSTGLKKNIPKKSKFYNFDIQNTKKLKQLLNNNNVDIVMHFAAYINNEESIKKPKKYFQNNYLNGKVFFSMCIKSGVKKFIYSSTAAVYGNKTKKASEYDSLKPMSPYPRSKLKLEKYLEKNQKKISCIILRYFNVAGADKNLRCGFNIKKGYNLILNLCRAAVKNEKLRINGDNYKTKDGTTIRDFIHVSDLAEIHYKVSKFINNKKIFFILNCGYGFGFSVLEILKEFTRVSKKELNHFVGERRKGDIVISIANPKKLKKLISWKPKYQSLNLLVTSSLKWYKKSLRA